MGALTGASTVPVDHAACHESLADRMARGPLPLTEALRYATQIATILRDLHEQGLVYGAVSPQLILLTSRGASLRDTAGLRRLGHAQLDVADFGLALAEALRGGEGEGRLREESRALAIRCCQEPHSMQQVLVTLRVITLELRQVAFDAGRPRPVRRPPTIKPQARSWMAFWKLAMAWRPAFSLPALTVSGK